MPSCSRCLFPLTLLCCIWLVTSCAQSDSGAPPLQPAAELPDEFVDNLGATWLCEQRDEQTQVRGTVDLLEPSRVPLGSDILHVALFEGMDEQRTLISSYCMNNIAKTPIRFAISYDEQAINPDARYTVSANYFQLELDGSNLYAATHKRDGEHDVITNGVTEGLILLLPSVGR